MADMPTGSHVDVVPDKTADGRYSPPSGLRRWFSKFAYSYRTALIDDVPTMRVWRTG